MLPVQGFNYNYLKSLSDYPLAVVFALGDEWTWAESSTMAVAVRGRVPGLPPGTVSWREPESWRNTMRWAFEPAGSRVRAHALPRGGLVQWAGPAWVPPERPCPSCRGTGVLGGTPGDLARPGALVPGVVLDRNLLARALPLFPAGALIVEARPRREAEPVVLRAPGNEARAVIARLRVDDAGEPFTAWLAARGGRQLVLSTPDESWPDEVTRPSRPAARRVTSERTHPVLGPGDERCDACGRGRVGGVCPSCGA